MHCIVLFSFVAQCRKGAVITMSSVKSHPSGTSGKHRSAQKDVRVSRSALNAARKTPPIKSGAFSLPAIEAGSDSKADATCDLQLL